MSLPRPDYSKAQVLVSGDLMLDRYWYGDSTRISPEAPIPVVHIQRTEERAGGAANVAMNLAALGASPRLMGIIGADEAGARLSQLLAAAGISHHFLNSAEHPTVLKLRVLNRQQQSIRLDFEERFPQEESAQLLAHTLEQLPEARVLVLSDYAKGSLQHCPALIAAAREANIPVLVDPKGRDFAPYRGASVVTPNFQEFEALAGACPTERDIALRGLSMLRRYELQALLITRGAQGMTLLLADGGVRHFSARSHEVFDVTGAGDTVIAALAAGCAKDLALEDAAELANIAAGLAVRKRGTATVTQKEIWDALAAQPDNPPGMLAPQELPALGRRIRQRGERLVMTNGCFDILHAGHLAFLEEARKQGDQLLVALNDDASVRRLKGRERPVNPLAQRLRALAELQCVDWVVGFGEDTPEALLELVQPDILVKGGDYSSLEEVVGAPIVQAYGGEVRLLAHHPQHSTRGIVAARKEAAS